MPTPLKLFTRLLVVGALVLWVAHHYQRAILELLLPVVSTTVNLIDNSFTVVSVAVADVAGAPVLRLRANLARPTVVGGRTFYPIGWDAASATVKPSGWYEVTLTAGGAMAYSWTVLIVAWVWPVSRWQEALKRLLVSLPLMLILLLVNVAITFPAELWSPIHDDWIPDITWPLLVSSRILMGGGGLMLGLIGGVISILISQAGTLHKQEIKSQNLLEL